MCVAAGLRTDAVSWYKGIVSVAMRVHTSSLTRWLGQRIFRQRPNVVGERKKKWLAPPVEMESSVGLERTAMQLPEDPQGS